MNDCVLIQNTVSRFFADVDRCDWEAVQFSMTNPFHVDYSSYGGGEPADVTPKNLTYSWAAFMPYFDSVHHQIGNTRYVRHSRREHQSGTRFLYSLRQKRPEWYCGCDALRCSMAYSWPTPTFRYKNWT